MATASKRLQGKSAQFNTRSPSNIPAVVPIDLAMLALNDKGVIQNCSQTCERVFGYRQDELAGRHVSTLLPELVDTELVLEDRINARLVSPPINNATCIMLFHTHPMTRSWLCDRLNCISLTRIAS